MKSLAQDLHIGDKVVIAGVPCKIRGVQKNDRDGIILNLQITGLPYSKAFNRKAAKTRNRAKMTVIVHRKTLLTISSKGARSRIAGGPMGYVSYKRHRK